LPAESSVKQRDLPKSTDKVTETNESSFTKSIKAGTYTGKEFDKKVKELSKEVEQCVITKSIVDYISMCIAIDILETTLTVNKKLPEHIQIKGLEQKLESFRNERTELQSEIVGVIKFGLDTPLRTEELQQYAHSDEDKALLTSVKERFGEKWDQVQSDLKVSNQRTCEILVVQTKKSSEYLAVFDIDAIQQEKDDDIVF
jgi:hypothetical protein